MTIRTHTHKKKKQRNKFQSFSSEYFSFIQSKSNLNEYKDKNYDNIDGMNAVPLSGSSSANVVWHMLPLSASISHERCFCWLSNFTDFLIYFCFLVSSFLSWLLWWAKHKTGFPDQSNTYTDIQDDTIVGQFGELAVGAAAVQRGIHRPIV